MWSWQTHWLKFFFLFFNWKRRKMTIKTSLFTFRNNIMFIDRNNISRTFYFEKILRSIIHSQTNQNQKEFLNFTSYWTCDDGFSFHFLFIERVEKTRSRSINKHQINCTSHIRLEKKLYNALYIKHWSKNWLHQLVFYQISLFITISSKYWVFKVFSTFALIICIEQLIDWNSEIFFRLSSLFLIFGHEPSLINQRYHRYFWISKYKLLSIQTLLSSVHDPLSFKNKRFIFSKFHHFREFFASSSSFFFIINHSHRADHQTE